MRALLQGNVLLGKADGGTGGLPAGIQPGQEYDIFAGSGIGYVELDLGIVRPFLLGVYGTADGDPRDRQLSGFEVQPQGDSTQWATDMLSHFDRSSAAGGGGTIRVRRGCVGCGAQRPRTTPMPLARTSRRRVVVPLLLPLPNVTIKSRTCGMGSWGTHRTGRS